MNELAQILTNRGLVYQHTGESLEEITKDKRTLYLGFDPTADSLHVGHLAPYMIVRQFVKAGGKAILLVGGGTGMIGDPSFKDSERQLLTDDEVRKNADKIAQQVKQILQTEDIAVVNNYDWLSKVSVIEFLRDTGKHFTVNSMIKKEMVADRVNDPDKSISYTEFSYPLLQGFDFHHLHKEHGCTLQVGGSDQWGNVLAGVEYIRRVEGVETHGITAPIIVDKVTGKKFGKSEGNAIWLDAEKTSPYAFYQFWVNQDDAGVIDYLKIFTDLSLEEIRELEEVVSSAPHERRAQKQLALAVTAMIHGNEEAVKARDISEALFAGDISALSEEAKQTLVKVAPTYQFSDSELVVDALVHSGLATSKREAKTLITQGGVMVSGLATVDEQTALQAENHLHLLKKGKREVRVLVHKTS